MKIYTKTGDKGTTSLLGGSRVAKNHPQIETYGENDLLISQMGYLISLLENKDNNEIFKDEAADLYNIQSELFCIGSSLASENDTDIFKFLKNTVSCTQFLEKKIDQYSAELPPLKNFILPGGDLAAAHCHIVRCQARNTERKIIDLENESYKDALIYINRLSDYFFVLARYINFKRNREDIAWTFN